MSVNFLRDVGNYKNKADVEDANEYILPGNLFSLYDFYSRKMMLLTTAKYLVFFPGGMGTLDEFSEIINLIKVDPRIRKNNPKIYLCHKKFWNGMKELYESCDLNFPNEHITLITDSIDDIMKDILSSSSE